MAAHERGFSMPKSKVKYTPTKISSRVGQGVFIKKVKHRAFKALPHLQEQMLN